MRLIFIAVLSIAVNGYVAAKTYLFIGAEFPSILERNEDGEVAGLGADIAKIIASKLGHEIEFELYPWKRALRMMQRNSADVLIGPYRSADRESFLHFNQYPFYQDPIVFYARKNDDFIWNGNFSALHNKKIGVIRGWSFGTEFDQYKDKLNIQVVGSVEANIQKLLLKRIDLFISHPRHIARLIKKLDLENKLKIIMPPIIINNGFFGFSKNKSNAEFIAQFDQEFKKMIDSGEIMSLNKKHNLYVGGE